FVDVYFVVFQRLQGRNADEPVAPRVFGDQGGGDQFGYVIPGFAPQIAGVRQREERFVRNRVGSTDRKTLNPSSDPTRSTIVGRRREIPGPERRVEIG